MGFAVVKRQPTFGFIHCLSCRHTFFGGAVKGAKSEASYKNNRWGKIAITITIIGFLTHLGYFITRWMASGHAPVSNMFEFMTAFGMMIVGAFILLFFLYRTPSLGLFALPIAVIIIGYASMFPREITPLIPALQSYWLWVHVITAALGEAITCNQCGCGVHFLAEKCGHDQKIETALLVGGGHVYTYSRYRFRSIFNYI